MPVDEMLSLSLLPRAQALQGFPAGGRHETRPRTIPPFQTPLESTAPDPQTISRTSMMVCM